jgi:2-polyprenyl-3-methyl-5-hydroxy-6-metoxy-1,4-benzoquinol methylase
MPHGSRISKPARGVVQAASAVRAASLNQRHLVAEQMDQPDLDPGLHAQALTAIGRINVLSMPDVALWGAISPIARSTPIRVLDVASGGGDVAVALARKAARAGLPVTVEGCDMSDEAVRYARSMADRRGVDAKFFVHDVIAAGMPEGYDVVYSTLFFHHLTNEAAARLLANAVAAAKRLVIVNDLIRSRAGLALAYLASRTLTTSPVVRFDAPQSVRAAYTMAEFKSLAESAGIHGGRIAWQWPFRFQFEYSQDNA